MQKIIDKYFDKLDKNVWAVWDDFMFKGYVSGEYGYYLKATLHCPKGSFSKNDSIDVRAYKIIVHRYYDRLKVEDYLNTDDSRMVYYGLLENEEDLKFLLYKCGIVENPIK